MAGFTERSITGAETAPSTVAHGTALGGKRRIWWLQKSLSSVSSYGQSLYLYDGDSGNPAWVQVQETVETGKTTTDANFYDVPCDENGAVLFTRYKVNIDAFTGTSMVHGHYATEGGAT